MNLKIHTIHSLILISILSPSGNPRPPSNDTPVGDTNPYIPIKKLLPKPIPKPAPKPPAK